jgi:uncharacterized protein YdhG (YjbR/CyaY superfamily)
MSTKPKTVPEYIAGLPPEQAKVIKKVRAAIRRAVPGAEEKTSYGMAAVVVDGRYTFYYGAWAKHIGMYPISGLSAKLEKKVAPYRKTENTLNFKYVDGVPFDLIEEVAEAMVK